MILLDTHIWIWWVNGGDGLTPEEKVALLTVRVVDTPLAVSAISCWEVGILASKGRLPLALPVDQWIARAVGPSGVTLVPLSPEVAVASSFPPERFTVTRPTGSSSRPLGLLACRWSPGTARFASTLM